MGVGIHIFDDTLLNMFYFQILSFWSGPFEIILEFQVGLSALTNVDKFQINDTN